MRFDYNSYEKLYPRQTETPEHIETAVEGFTPTQDKIDETPAAAPAPAKAPEQVVTKTAPTPEPEPIPAGDPGELSEKE